jgi:hypothetical protein
MPTTPEPEEVEGTPELVDNTNPDFRADVEETLALLAAELLGDTE